MISQPAVQKQFGLTPSMAKLLIMLLEKETVPAEDIVSAGIAKSAKVIVHRLRSSLPDIKVESRIGVGYWISPEHRKELLVKLGLITGAEASV